MTHDAALKAQISALLQNLGFHVEDLEVKEGRQEGEKTPDFLAIKEERFLIEVKEKQDDPAKIEEEARIAVEGGIAERHEFWGPKNTVARIVRAAKQQLEAWPEVERDYSLIWLHAGGRDAESQWAQFKGTLFGTTSTYTMDDSPMKECFFFHDSAFFRWRQVLDGAILTSTNEGQFWVNPLSQRADQLKESAMTRAFGHCLDPRDLEREGEIYIADCAIDRKDTDGVKRYLRKKYDTAPLDHIHFGRMGFIVYLGEDD